MQGEFSIIKGYGGEASNLFSVTNPHKNKGQDFIVYTVSVSNIYHITDATHDNQSYHLIRVQNKLMKTCFYGDIGLG